MISVYLRQEYVQAVIMVICMSYQVLTLILLDAQTIQIANTENDFNACKTVLD